MKANGRYFSTETLTRIQNEVDTDPTISRRTLSRKVCEWMDWYAPNGKPQEMGCRVALGKLHQRGAITLPPRTGKYDFQQPGEHQANSVWPQGAPPAVNCPLDELGDVKICAVSSRYAKSSGVWNAVMDEFHEYGSGPLCGAQIRYLIQSERYGLLGAMSFSSPTYRLKARDRWIGWSEAARHAHLREVVLNSRFLILPTVKVENLASHVLSLALKRLCVDWKSRYGVQPALVETFVDPRKHTGACYRAAGWRKLGQTAGGKQPYANGKVSDGAKDIYVRALREDVREILCVEPKRVRGSRQPLPQTGDWIQEEFHGIALYDDRLERRLHTLVKDFYAQPGVLVPQACNGSQAKMKGTYRFLKNAQVNMDILLDPHIESTVLRMRQHQVVLSVQDTTTLNYTAHPLTEGLGPINTTKDGGLGLILHDTMAFSVEGTPLGLLDARCWARDPKRAGQSKDRKKREIEDKESFKWIQSYRATAEAQAACPETMVVSVGDREADIYELFAEVEATCNGPKLLVRADRGRKRRVENEDEDENKYLWDEMASKCAAGHMEVYIPRKGGRPGRHATLTVRHAYVALTPPKKKLDSVKVWAVHALEENPMPGVDPVQWMLLTTVETKDHDDACERLRWYATRWCIEVYHRTLKSGCRIEDRRFNNADSIETCLAIDMVIAWRIYMLTKQGRETPNIPCDVYLSEEE